MLSVGLVLLRSRWIALWLRLELNLTLIVFVFFHLRDWEVTIKYFIVQTFNSLLIVLSIMLTITTLIILLAITKMGLVPFHLWFQDLIKFISTSRFFLLLSIQKLPLLVIAFLFRFNFSILLLRLWVVLRRFLTLAVRGIYFLIFFSSVIHSYFLLISQILSWQLFVGYFTLYSRLCFLLSLRIKNRYIRIYFAPAAVLFTFLVFSGIPPFIMFFIKLTIIITLIILIKTQLLLWVTAITCRFFFYFRILFFSRFFYNEDDKSNYNRILIARILISTGL